MLLLDVALDGVADEVVGREDLAELGGPEHLRPRLSLPALGSETFANSRLRLYRAPFSRTQTSTSPEAPVPRTIPADRRASWPPAPSLPTRCHPDDLSFSKITLRKFMFSGDVFLQLVAYFIKNDFLPFGKIS